MRRPLRLHRVDPGAAVDLAAIDSGDVAAAPGGKDETRAATVPLASRLVDVLEGMGLLWPVPAEGLADVVIDR